MKLTIKRSHERGLISSNYSVSIRLMVDVEIAKCLKDCGMGSYVVCTYKQNNTENPLSLAKLLNGFSQSFENPIEAELLCSALTEKAQYVYTLSDVCKSYIDAITDEIVIERKTDKKIKEKMD